MRCVASGLFAARLNRQMSLGEILEIPGQDVYWTVLSDDGMGSRYDTQEVRLKRHEKKEREVHEWTWEGEVGNPGQKEERERQRQRQTG